MTQELKDIKSMFAKHTIEGVKGKKVRSEGF